MASNESQDLRVVDIFYATAKLNFRAAENKQGKCNGLFAFWLPRRRLACYKLRMAQLKIGFLGAGKMATALAQGFV